MAETEKRIYVGGLFCGVKESEISERFSRFGLVKQVEIKVRPSDNGSPAKTFAYVSLQTNEEKLKKCFNTYSKTKWKGGVLKLQLAKDNFIERLQRERIQEAENKNAEVPPEPVLKSPIVENRLESIPGLDNFQMKGAKPGTAIPGEKDWIVGKYGRVLPVVNVKKRGSKRLIKVDPSKLTHNVKRINDDLDVNNASNITWELDERESEITKRRKGEFDERAAKRHKKDSENASLKKVFEVLENEKILAKERRNAAMEVEVVPVNPVFETDLAKKLLDISAKTKFDSDSENERKRPVRFGDKHKAEKKAEYLKRREERIKKKEEEEKNKGGQINENAKGISQKAAKNNKVAESEAKNDKSIDGKVDKTDKGIDAKANRNEKKTEGEASKKVTRKERLNARWKDIVEAKKERKKANRAAYLAKKNTKVGTKPGNGIGDNGVEDNDAGDESDSSTNTIELLKQKKSAITKVSPGGKKETVKSWLNANSFVNEFSDGFIESAKKSRYQANESGDSDDEDDFKAFVQNEMKKVSKRNFNHSYQVTEVNDHDDDSMELEIVEAKTSERTPNKYHIAKSMGKKNETLDQTVNEGITDKPQLKKLKTAGKSNLPKSPLENKRKDKAVKLDANAKLEDSDNKSVSSADTVELMKRKTHNNSKTNETTNKMKSKPPDPKTKIRDHKIDKNVVEGLKIDEESSDDNSGDSNEDDGVDDDSSESEEDDKYSISDEDDGSDENDTLKENANSANNNIKGEKQSKIIVKNVTESNVKSVSKVENHSKDSTVVKDGVSKSTKEVKTNIIEEEMKSESSDASDDNDENEDSADDDESDLESEESDEEEGEETDSDDDESDNEDADDDSEDDFKALISNEMKKVTASDSISHSANTKTLLNSEAKSIDSSDSENDSMEITATVSKNVKPEIVQAIKNVSKPATVSSETVSSDSDSSESESVSDGESESDGDDEVNKKVPENFITKPSSESSDSESTASESSGSEANEFGKGAKTDIKQETATTENRMTKTTQAAKADAKVEAMSKKATEVSRGAKSERDRSMGGAKPEDVDKKRLEAVRQRKEETKQQKNAIQKALAGIDQKGTTPNKKIVFADDDDMGGGGDANNYSGIMGNENNAMGNAKSKIPQRDKASKLFDSSSSDNSDNDDDDDARFQIKEQFEGSAGTKLAMLQSRYSNDERFKLDTRFAESGSEEEDSGVVQETDLGEEKLRSMRILQSVIGTNGIKALSRQEKAKKQFKDIKTLQYDPSLEEHKQFEVKKDPTKPKAKKKKSKNIDSSDDDDDDDNNQVPPEEVIIPEVSTEKFVEVTDTLRDTFINKAREPERERGGGTFSLLAAFGRAGDVERDDGEHEEQALSIPASLRTDQLSLDNRFKVADDNDISDDSLDDNDDDDALTPRKSGESMEVDKDSDSETDDTPVAAANTFFFVPDDPRLKEGAKFHRQDDLEKVREKWLEKRFQLIEAYKSKHKNYKRKHKDSGGKQTLKGGKYQRRKL